MIDTNTLILVMAMSGTRNNNMMLPLLLLSGGLGGDTTGSSNILSTALSPNSLMYAMLPGLGTVGKMLLGGVGAVLAGKLFNPRRRTYRRRTRVVYRNNYRRRRYY